MRLDLIRPDSFSLDLDVLHTVWLMTVDGKETRACLMLNVAFGVPLPKGFQANNVKIPDLTRSLSVRSLRKKNYAGLVNKILLLAIERGMEELAEMIVGSGYPKDMNDPILDSKKCKRNLLPSYFLVVVSHRRCKLAKLMIDKGANVNQVWLGMTPLLVATMNNGGPSKSSLLMVKILLSAGADPGIGISFQSLNRLQKCYHHSSRDLFPVRLKEGQIRRIFPLEFACATGDCEMVMMLLNAMRKLDISLNNFPLSFLCQSDIDICVRLVKAGVDVNHCDAAGNTALHRAARLGATEVLAVLLHSGAFIDAKNRWSRTPLHEAALSGSEHAMHFLILRDADCSIDDFKGRTALELALMRGIRTEDLLECFVDDDREIDDLIDQVKAFDVSTELVSKPKKKRRFKVENMFPTLPRWLGGSGKDITIDDESSASLSINDKESICR